MKQVIMVTGNGKFDILQQTINVLDDPDIDFFVYVNNKRKFPELKTKLSKIKYVKGNKVKWGHFSEIKAELTLIREALKYNYEYYHFININDFPLMDKNYFKKYFSSKPIKLGFSEYLEKCELWEIQHNYPLKFINLQRKVFPGLYVRIVNVFGKILNTNRINDKKIIEKGFPYFSLPRKYVERIANFGNIDLFKNTLDGHEFFNQIILKDLKPDNYSVENSIYSRKYRMMRSAAQASRLVNYLRKDNFNWFYFPEYKYDKNDFRYLREKTNYDLAFVHTIKSGEKPLLIFKEKGE